MKSDRACLAAPPPLASTAATAVRLGTATLEYNWVAGLPEWLVPIVWGLVFAMPAVAFILLIARGLGVGTVVFMGAAFLASVCAIPALFRERRRSVQLEAEEIRELQSRFRDVLVSMLRSHPANQIDYEPLAEESGLDREDADAVARSIYIGAANRVVSDGIITPKERQKLEALSGALGLSVEESARIEREAASSRFRQAMSDALSDGVITAEEKAMLDGLRINLGIGETD